MFSQQKWLMLYRTLVGCLIILTLGLLGFYFLAASPSLEVPEPPKKNKALLLNEFAQPKESYSELGNPLLQLSKAPPRLELPDLRQILYFYGNSGRPDIEEGNGSIHFGLKSDPTPHPLPLHGRLYLAYDAQLTPPQYVFSQNNKETGLWMEAVAKDREAEVNLYLKNEAGEVIHQPESLASFKLKAREFLRTKGGGWNIGPHQVDGALLARQQARWYGEDVFLKEHGGDEYSALMNKQRIDFEIESGRYSLFAKEGDCFLWKGERWYPVTPGVDSRGYPLLVVNKVSERVIQFSIWDVEGKRKVALNLIKSADIWNPKETCRDIRFVGSRTLKQILVEMRGERLTLKPLDWILLEEEGWKKLTTAEDIDDYVERRKMGPLFVFRAVVKKEDEQVLIGVLYSASRAQMEEIEIPLHQAAPSTHLPSQKLPVSPLIEGRENASIHRENPSTPKPPEDEVSQRQTSMGE